MSATSTTIRIATRASPLALWQAHHVRDRLMAADPALRVELLEMTTRGDQILDRTLSKVGGKGLFVKELETALLDGSADLAVHSLKDVPMVLAPAFALARGTGARGPARLPGQRALSEPRIHARRRPRRHRQPAPRNDAAGAPSAPAHRTGAWQCGHAPGQARSRRLRRLADGRGRFPAPGTGATHHADAADRSLPAGARAGGAGHKNRAGDTAIAARLAALEHAPTRAIVTAERAVSRGLGGSCEFPWPPLPSSTRVGNCICAPGPATPAWGRCSRPRIAGLRIRPRRSGCALSTCSRRAVSSACWRPGLGRVGAPGCRRDTGHAARARRD